ncbi:PP0621 family protein [Candidatus Vesicomyidisocius sp. SY067_SCS001]|uniref:PP0621 family protein n=1 Tax=Candidatus Vesicomyidisocius sp. SY067_SCS001 TaxID=2732590 RepID=UPI0016849EA4|nr:PP0621 family protein [Candidatus Vesicomyosocius sp. SY067_SCS001]
MGIVKLIIIVLFVWMGFWLLKKFRKPIYRIKQKSSSNIMLACSVCKIHIPKNEAIIQNNKAYCSKEHLE